MFARGIPIDKEDCILIDRANYKLRRYRYYWRNTHQVKFLYLYQQNLKAYHMAFEKIAKKYLKNIPFKYFTTDLSNLLIYYVG